MSNRGPAALKRHYRDYQGKPEQIKKRSERNKARRMMEKAGEVKKGDGKDVHHVKPMAKGGKTTKGNLRVTSKAANRGYARTKTNKPK